jgi:hypothetical protein
MIWLVVGTKGGVGTTTLARELVQSGQTLAVDLADGELAAQLERPTWMLNYDLYNAPVNGIWRSQLIEAALKRSITLLWQPECGDSEVQWSFVRDLANRRTVVLDGGITPPAGIDWLAKQVVIVSQNNAVARWHEARLRVRYPEAQVVDIGTRQAAREVAAQLFQGVSA